MATSSKKTTTTPAASSTPSKKTVAEKVVVATADKKVNAPTKSVKGSAVTPEERCHMIATAAYFRAEQRGFAGGYEMADWIAAEAQIDAKLTA